MKSESQLGMPNEAHSAFPYLLPDRGTYSEGTCGYGLTKLEYFAGLAMQGILANPFFTAKLDTFTDIKDAAINELVAKVAIASAKALLQKLQTQGEE